MWQYIYTYIVITYTTYVTTVTDRPGEWFRWIEQWTGRKRERERDKESINNDIQGVVVTAAAAANAMWSSSTWQAVH